jgi:hypothetical protein
VSRKLFASVRRGVGPVLTIILLSLACSCASPQPLHVDNSVSAEKYNRLVDRYNEVRTMWHECEVDLEKQQGITDSIDRICGEERTAARWSGFRWGVLTGSSAVSVIVIAILVVLL